MSDGADRPDVDVRPRGPTAPTARPTWLLVLSSLTLVYGGLLLVSGLNALRDPVGSARVPISQSTSPDREVLNRQLAEAGTETLKAHLGGIRGRAVASLVVALVMLYSAAAAMSRDRNGRTAMLVAAWLGIGYQVGSLPVAIPIARDYAAATAPLLAQAILTQLPVDATAADPPPKPETVAQVMRWLFVVLPIFTAVVGIGGSTLLLIYYGGRRGRALYGLLPPRQ